VVAGSLASANRGGRTKVLCLVYKGGQSYRLHRTTPRECVGEFKGRSGTGLLLRHMRWQHWGRSRARGKGGWTMPHPDAPGDVHIHVHVRLSRPLQRCGYTVFSRAHVRYTYTGSTRGYDNSSKTGSLYTC
jgi:hypothetical protein